MEKSKGSSKNKQKLSTYLQKARLNAELSQKQVADELGYTSAQFISNMERGVCSPPLKTIRTLIDLYRLDPNELFVILLSEQERVIRDSIYKTKSKKNAKGA